ncbi:uncharacterized protein MYCFIDRAFT_84797 [Pseudocercospora fijiensis CIRAD86]|uniref:Fe2OG dioxygenase domain-containing protein n=1 Tax=Pseudocercospora fijiensis (strain CIRAD86) TaxID=383855 RepID=M2ZZV3_PSEFD|nr:uncharacterized protein MYCFIDRAFT_84797 [Pseudocercospora fijiensis CIRAD86]EME77686.1 hypothetical protein MYCFIDRAFT_84797 [Pseudocercospora fijiensis CIRAD86]
MPSATRDDVPGDELPVVNFSSFDSDAKIVSAKLLAAAKRWGFLVLTGHGIPGQVINDMLATTSSFFDQPEDVKAEKWMNIKQQGYDYKESIIGVSEGMCFGSVANANLTCDNIPSWWTAEKKQQAETFRTECNTVAQRVLSAFAIAMNLESDFFSRAHSPMKEPGNVLRLIRYPVVDKPVDASFPRLGEHTDWGTITLLFATEPGLEVLSPDNDRWVAAPIVEEGIIVNVGDGLALWTAGLLKSTKHRLSWESLPGDKSRESMAYFVNANADAPLKCVEQDAATGRCVEACLPFDATFGDYQNARMRLYHEKFNSDGTDDELKVDARFLQMVRNIGVAHGTGIDFEGTHDASTAS